MRRGAGFIDWLGEYHPSITRASRQWSAGILSLPSDTLSAEEDDELDRARSPHEHTCRAGAPPCSLTELHPIDHADEIPPLAGNTWRRASRLDVIPEERKEPRTNVARDRTAVHSPPITRQPIHPLLVLAMAIACWIILGASVYSLIAGFYSLIG